MNLDVAQILIAVPIFLFSLTVHEFAHGYIAYRLGDPTAKNAGRLTFNPIPHIDPMGALAFVISDFTFGWARPVPVMPYNFKDVKKGMLWSAAAGPASNLILAFGFGLLFRIAPGFVDDPQFSDIVAAFTLYGVRINCALAFFNMIPLPPLDGSKILFGLLPDKYDHIALRLERIGPIGLIVLIMMGLFTGISVIWMIIGPFVTLFYGLFTGIGS
jgi:Zn-dependent protease